MMIMTRRVSIPLELSTDSTRSFIPLPLFIYLKSSIRTQTTLNLPSCVSHKTRTHLVYETFSTKFTSRCLFLNDKARAK
jgi:hypothetical protein